jgi:hypothetical protein
VATPNGARLGWSFAADLSVVQTHRGTATVQSSSRGFRLAGLAGQGAIPWACVGLVVVLVPTALTFVRDAALNLSVGLSSRKGVPMGQKTHRNWLRWSTGLETVWAIGASSVASALPA